MNPHDVQIKDVTLNYEDFRYRTPIKFGGVALDRVTLLNGTMTPKNGATLYFCIFVNNVPLPEGVGSSREGKQMGKLCEVLYESK